MKKEMELRLSLLSLGAVVVLLFICWMSLCRADGIPASLKLKTAGFEQEFSLEDLKKRFHAVSLSVYDPVYQKEKSYRGFLLSDVLSLFGAAGSAALDTEIVFTAADGFSPSMLLADQKKRRAIVAFSDATADPNDGVTWELLSAGKKKLSPAPFYVVWDSPKLAAAYPRPYQLIKIELVSLREKFPKIFPGEGVSAEALRGFLTFRSNCLMCHSMNLEGGDVGPELNIPKNITEYRDAQMLKSYIRKVSAFRAKSKMPDFPQLTNQELDGLISYFKYMGRHKIVPR